MPVYASLMVNNCVNKNHATSPIKQSQAYESSWWGGFMILMKMQLQEQGGPLEIWSWRNWLVVIS